MQIQFNSNDEKMIIEAMSGIIFYKKNINDCYKKLDKIYEEVLSVLSTWKDLGKETYEHKGSNAKITDYVIENDTLDEIQVACYDYHDKSYDHFRIALRSYEYRLWLQEEAYK